MELDAKQRVLTAIYAEHQKEKPDMRMITFRVLGMEDDIFTSTLTELQRKNFIDGFSIDMQKREADLPADSALDAVVITPAGAQYVEKLFDVDTSLPGTEKLNVIAQKLRVYREGTLQQFVAWVLLQPLAK